MIPLKEDQPARHTARTKVMGVMNATPDSFYEPSRFSSEPSAREIALKMVDDGADIIDIGGESSRPGAEPVSLEEELARIVPLIEAVEGLKCQLSIDTYHAETAKRAIELGATMVNDITALRGDADMAEAVADGNVDCVLMHMQGMPQTMQHEPIYEDIVDDIRLFFEARVEYAISKGISEDRIWLDPGFGFGKTVEHNLNLLRRLSEFRDLGFPILVGTSNKSMIGAVLDAEISDRLEGTAATVSVAICQGADGVRVHDVGAMSKVARMTDAIVRKELF